MRDANLLLEEILQELRPMLTVGHVADYIPALASIPRTKFGIAVATADGEVYRAGDADEPFSVQSISKVYMLTLALRSVGDKLWQRVGREPSGNAFNSLVQLEIENGIPRNPFINAGAHILTDVVLSTCQEPRDALLDFVRKRSNNPSVSDDADVARSESAHGARNAALANFMRSFGNLDHSVEDVLDLYFFHCSLRMSCVDLARSFLFLSNAGLCPWTGEQVLTADQARRVNAMMLMCGTYDAAGDFAYRVGMPAKSGVGGGIVAVVPNRLTVAVWSPALNAKGNSVAGTAALEALSQRGGYSIF
ncbi:MAG: glutaminase [Rhodanobacter sp.]